MSTSSSPEPRPPARPLHRKAGWPRRLWRILAAPRPGRVFVYFLVFYLALYPLYQVINQPYTAFVVKITSSVFHVVTTRHAVPSVSMDGNGIKVKVLITPRGGLPDPTAKVFTGLRTAYDLGNYIVFYLALLLATSFQASRRENLKAFLGGLVWLLAAHVFDLSLYATFGYHEAAAVLAESRQYAYHSTLHRIVSFLLDAEVAIFPRAVPLVLWIFFFRKRLGAMARMWRERRLLRRTGKTPV